MWLTDALESAADKVPRFLEFLVEIAVFLQIHFLAIVYIFREFLFHWKRSFSTKNLSSIIESSVFNQRRTKCAVITGADGTIGTKLVARLLRLRWEVHCLVHNEENAKVVFGNSGILHESRLHITEVDLADLEQTSVVANVLCERLPHIDLIVCAAAVMLSPKPFTSDVRSEQLNVNVFSQVLLVKILKAKMSPDCRTLLVSSVCSRAAYLPRKFLTSGSLSVEGGPYQTYAFSKLLMALSAAELSRTLSEAHPDARIISVHPGVVPGGLYRNTNAVTQFITYYILPYILRSADWAACLCLHTLFRSDIVNGAYYEDTHVQRIRPTLDRETRQRFFERILAEVQEHEFPALKR